MNTDMVPTGSRDDIESGEFWNKEWANIAGALFFEWLNDLIDDVEGVTEKEKNTKKEVLKKESTRVRIADIKRDTEITIDPYLLKLLNHFA